LRETVHRAFSVKVRSRHCIGRLDRGKLLARPGEAHKRRERVVCAMKMHIEIDMTPEEARKFLGLPDVTTLQDKMLAEMEKRMKAAIDVNDPEAMLKAWMPLGGQGFEQFQRFLFDSARRASGTAARKDADKTKG